MISYDGLYEQLRNKGITKTDAYTGKPMTFFRDPDGLPIEIHE